MGRSDSLLRQSLRNQTRLHEAWNNRGNALDDLGRGEEAIASYDKALEIKPDYTKPGTIGAMHWII
jgi:tetratricopeptide (TPR) repeat protein